MAARLRAQNCVCGTVQLGIRDPSLRWYERQEKVTVPISNSTGIFESAYHLFTSNRPGRPVRSLSVRVSGLSPSEDAPQLSFLPEDEKHLKQDDLERAKDMIQRKYGYSSIRRGILLTDPALDLNIRESSPGYLFHFNRK